MGLGAQCAECRAARFWHALIFKAYWPSYTHLIDGCCGQHILPRSLASCAPFLKDQSKNFKACAAFWETGCVACRSAKVRPTIGQAFCRGIGAIGSEDFVQSMRSKAALKVCTLGATIAPFRRPTKAATPSFPFPPMPAGQLTVAPSPTVFFHCALVCDK